MGTKIFDCHTHLFRKEGYVQLDVLNNLTKTGEVVEYKKSEDYECYLRSQGIDRAVILAEQSPMINVMSTEDVVKFCYGNNYFLPFATLNPNMDNDIDKKLEYYIVDLKVKGLKLYPSHNYYYPNESKLYKMYAVAEKFKIPVMLHIGSSVFRGARMKYCDPIYLDDVAQDFPGLTIIMSHGGRGFDYNKAFFLSRLHKNIFIDITGLPPSKLLIYYPDFETNIDKFIFGSDYPGIPNSIRENIDKIMNLPLSDSSIEKLFYKNAEKILLA